MSSPRVMSLKITPWHIAMPSGGGIPAIKIRARLAQDLVGLPKLAVLALQSLELRHHDRRPYDPSPLAACGRDGPLSAPHFGLQTRKCHKTSGSGFHLTGRTALEQHLGQRRVDEWKVLPTKRMLIYTNYRSGHCSPGFTFCSDLIISVSP